MADIKVTGELIATPRGTAQIFRLRTPRVTERTVRSLATRLGMRGAFAARLSSDDDKLIYAEGPIELTMYKASGGYRFIDRSRWQVDDRKSDLTMTDAAALRIAQRVARKYELAGGGQTRFLKAARLRVGEATSAGKEVTERTIDIAVALQRFVERTPVDGPGGKVVVYLDHKGDVTGIERLWRDTVGVHRSGSAFRSPQDALADMEAHYRSKQGQIDVQEIRYGYFEEGWRSRQRYLQPAYVVIGLLTSVDEGIRKRTVYVAPALANPIGTITPPLLHKPAQRARRSTR
jgi:hypothetical protein